MFDEVAARRLAVSRRRSGKCGGRRDYPPTGAACAVRGVVRHYVRAHSGRGGRSPDALPASPDAPTDGANALYIRFCTLTVLFIFAQNNYCLLGGNYAIMCGV